MIFTKNKNFHKNKKKDSFSTSHIDSVKIIPLGGLDGIGKNMQLIQYKDEIIIIDAGMMFPDETMPGIDKVIPDMTYISENKDKVKAIILTHGHEDHIGALSFLFDEINVPIYATKFTMALAENRLKGYQKKQIKKNIIKSRDVVQIGSFSIEFIQVNHSVPDGVGLAIKTPAGTIVHSGDFKIDFNAIDNRVIDLNRFAEIGDKGVLVFLSDSTNAEKAGFTSSESIVGESFEKIIKNAPKRVIVATFASNIHRIQQVINASICYNRKIFVLGKSIEDSVTIAENLGYLHYPQTSRISNLENLKKVRPNKITIITTGSQGEPMSALTRMAKQEYGKLKIDASDTIIISATPIPGNEKQVTRNVDKIFRLGANVIYEAESDVHVSGHACREEQKILLSLVKPKFFIPVHGEYRHLKYHAKLAESLGIPKKNILVPRNGDILEFSPNEVKCTGKVNADSVLVDGLGLGEKDNIVLQERKILAREGIILVFLTVSLRNKKMLSPPIVKSRGFVYVEEYDELIKKTIDTVKDKFNKIMSYNDNKNINHKTISNDIRKHLRDFLYKKTHRRPVVLVAINSFDHQKNK